MAGDINQERLFNSTNSISAFNNIQETHNALKEFEANTLSDETAVSSMSANFSSGKETSEATLDYEHLKTATEVCITSNELLKKKK
ncbi:MAG: hypothetical protein M1834_001505 [Cirrosporium novae-zelandiae]|nr:MAG: hypothetical protein M1834_004022 [Cirrosporium novae-zelandiae]KAI9735490.1 MAG: hypothetical protein M1834_001505 [Cirrosporium novae-zelandiae]